VEIKTRELLEKVVTDYPLLSSKGNPNMKEVARYLRIIEDHMIVQRISGFFSDMDCRFLILPTILTVVSAEKIRILTAQLRSEESGNPIGGEAYNADVDDDVDGADGMAETNDADDTDGLDDTDGSNYVDEADDV